MVLRLPVCLLLLLGVCSGVRLLVTTVSAFVPSSSSAAGSSSATFIAERIKLQQQQHHGYEQHADPHRYTRQRVITATATKATAATTVTDPEPCFDIDTALFCAGLAFDAYVEPPPDSSRWERGVRVMYLCFTVLFCFVSHVVKHGFRLDSIRFPCFIAMIIITEFMYLLLVVAVSDICMTIFASVSSGNTGFL